MSTATAAPSGAAPEVIAPPVAAPPALPRPKRSPAKRSAAEPTHAESPAQEPSPAEPILAEAVEQARRGPEPNVLELVWFTHRGSRLAAVLFWCSKQLYRLALAIESPKSKLSQRSGAWGKAWRELGGATLKVLKFGA